MDSDKLMEIIVEAEDTARIRRASASKKDTDPLNTQLFSNFFAGGFKGIQMDSDKLIDNYCRNRGHCKDPQSFKEEH